MTPQRPPWKRTCQTVGLLLLATPAVADVFGPGPDSPSLFDVVISLPGDPVLGDSIGSRESIGGDGQTTQLNLADGGSVGDFFAAESGSEVNISGGTVGISLRAELGSELNVAGGVVGPFVDAAGSTVNISGGQVMRGFSTFLGSVVNVSGGVVGDDFEANNGSVTNISGGSIGDDFVAMSGSVVNLLGGSIGVGFQLLPVSTLNIRGGSIGEAFFGFGGNVNLFGSGFLLDDVPLDGLNPGEALEITERSVTLSATLTDGSELSFDLNPRNIRGEDLFTTGTTLTVTLVVPGDYNGDSIVNAADYTVWRDGESANSTEVGYDRWATNYGVTLGASNAVPEPTGTALLASGLLTQIKARRKRLNHVNL